MIFVVARSSQYAASFSQRHQQLTGCLRFELGQTSFFRVINRIISEEHEPYACLVHDDVTLGHDFLPRLKGLVAQLDKDWPSWGVVGNAGFLSFRFGLDPTEVLRYVADPHRGPNMQGHVLPAQSIDGNVMLLNLCSLRRSGVVMPDWNGFQLYDIMLCIETARAGLAVLVAPELACWHGSAGSQEAFDSAASSDKFRSYLSDNLVNRFIGTVNGEVGAALTDRNIGGSGRIDLDLDSLRNSVVQRGARTVAICVRTQFKRPLLLRRTLETISAFVISAGSPTRFVIRVLTDKAEDRPDFIEDYAELVAITESGGIDSRNKLVRHAAYAIDADWFWFVDDDDWVFPNEAERLGLILNVVPLHATILLDTQHFNEWVSEKQSAIGTIYHGREARYFPAGDFGKSLGGVNHIPFCGMIVSRAVLKSIPESTYDWVVYYEDFSVLLHALLSPGALPIVVDRLYAGISMRDSGQSVNEIDRTKWDVSMSNLVASITCHAPAGALMTIPAPRHRPPISAPHEAPSAGIEPLAYLNRGERLILLCCRVVRAALKFSLSPSLWKTQGRILIRAGVQGGPRSVLRTMANFGRPQQRNP
ncbi:hypothetical protein JMJ55_21060 [Belnapia sp. T6]|uniref:Uncharacterized protein n=1 Tax=Belnapia mucosa TaxID=2804532 RepID=A0ABS1V846_9PROT|nr:hypothetical protein [Belnapia mucosa]MBL6457832.1 hypothetical protein [Belnapia mucosa]